MADQIQDKWRARAIELDNQFETFRAKANVDEDLVSAIKIAVLAEMLSALADFADILLYQDHLQGTQLALRKILARNQRVREALSGISDGAISDELDAIVTSERNGEPSEPAGGGTT